VDVKRSRLPDPTFWSGKRILLTGHTGFTGGWTALWLAGMGAKITGFALGPNTEPALFVLGHVERDLESIIGDLRNPSAVAAAVDTANPQIVIHLAAQALVRRSIQEPVETFATNVQGTTHLLDALRGRCGLEVVLVVTSDKVYANDELGRAFVETDRLGGKDPYSASKAATEIVTQAYAQSYFDKAGLPVATARSGNIIGGGDFAPDRLVPDVIRAIRLGKKLVLRHPEATRPWQHVLDCVAGYLLFIEALAGGRTAPRALNFGSDPSDSVTVATLAEAVFAALGQKPFWEHVPVSGSIEMKALTLDTSLARARLGWQDRLAGRTGISWTADWYRAYVAGEDPRSVTLGQIAAYRDLSPQYT
jgi:CDP-glucose 4,6-dehydratase